MRKTAPLSETYQTDLLVDNQLIVELKAVRALGEEHVAQMLGYLKSARIEHGLLINFGSYKFQIRKCVPSRNGPPPPRTPLSALS